MAKHVQYKTNVDTNYAVSDAINNQILMKLDTRTTNKKFMTLQSKLRNLCRWKKLKREIKMALSYSASVYLDFIDYWRRLCK